MMTQTTILIGAACAALGVWGMIATWPLMRQAATVALLAALMLGGVLAVLIGLSEVIDRRSRRRDAETSGAEKPHS